MNRIMPYRDTYRFRSNAIGFSGGNRNVEIEEQHQSLFDAEEESDPFLPNYDRNEVGRALYFASLPMDEDDFSLQKFMNLPSKALSKISVNAPSSAQLLSWLRMAGSGISVRQVISRAMEAISSYKIAASLDKQYNTAKIQEEIAQLEKVVQRADVKIQDLKEEEDIESNRRQAEKKQQKQQAQEMSLELKKKRIARYAKESLPLGDPLEPLFGRPMTREEEDQLQAELPLPVFSGLPAAEIPLPEAAAPAPAPAPVVAETPATPITTTINVTA